MRGATWHVERAAREMRKEPTPAELRLWRALRDRQVAGMKFRRQHAVGRFVLDFYCAEARLCIEVDGEIHEAQTERDEERTARLATAGIGVLRFRNDEVLTDLASVLPRIATMRHADAR